MVGGGGGGVLVGAGAWQRRGERRGADGGTLPDGGVECGFLVTCPDGGTDGGETDSGIPDSGPPELHPSVRAIDPPDGYTFVGRDTAVKVDVNLPNIGQGVDKTSLTSDNVRLLRASDLMPFEATVNTTGGGDAIVLQPHGLLDPRTSYIFQLSDRVKDQAGHSFIPFTSTFSTGDFTNLKIDPRYRYAVIDPPVWNGTPIDSLVFGPDGRLYGTDLLGIVRRWTLAPDGSLLNEEQWADLAGRTLIGIVFQPGDPNVFWVTTNAPVYIQPAQDWTGTVTKVTNRSAPARLRRHLGGHGQRPSSLGEGPHDEQPRLRAGRGALRHRGEHHRLGSAGPHLVQPQ